MKLLKMKCITDKARGDEALEPENQEVQYMVKLETKAEWRVYENFASYGTDKSALDSMIRSCDHGAYIMGDDDIVYYFGVLEQEPAIGETLELDNMEWERIA